MNERIKGKFPKNFKRKNVPEYIGQNKLSVQEE